jgi:nucleoside-diphosphate-sugar epimerase
MHMNPLPVLGTGLSGTIGRFLTGAVASIDVRLETPVEKLSLPAAPFAFIHAAAVVGERSVLRDISAARRVNVDATLELAEAVIRSACSKFVFVSTSHVYGVSAPGSLLSEESPVLPRGHYALQKLLAEEMLHRVFARQPQRLVIARVFSIIDGAQPPGTLGGAIRNLAENPSGTLPNASDERDFLTPGQTADLLLACARSHDLCGVVNVCSGSATSVGGVAQLMLGDAKFFKLADRIHPGVSDAPSIVGSVGKLRAHLPNETANLADTFRMSVRNVLAN